MTYKHTSGCLQLILWSYSSLKQPAGGSVYLKQVFLVRKQTNCCRRQIMNTEAEKLENVSQDFKTKPGFRGILL